MAQSTSLSVKDHTKIIEAAIANLPAIRKAVHGATTRESAAVQAFRSLLQLGNIEQDTHDRIREVITGVLSYEAGRMQLSGEHNKIVKTIRATLKPLGTIDAKIKELQALSKQFAADSTVSASIKVAIEILQDGSKTIYSPTWLSAHLNPSTSRGRMVEMEGVEEDIAGEDAAGAVAGGIEGALGGPFGGLGGAIVGAVVDSLVGGLLGAKGGAGDGAEGGEGTGGGEGGATGGG
jgi:hypothetical protein